MTTTARHARNDRIVQLRAGGLTYKQIAEEVYLTERQVARVLKERNQAAGSSSSPPASSTTASDATATELLDSLQDGMGDIMSIAREYTRGFTGAALRLEMRFVMAEQDMSELRRRTAQLAPPNPTGEGGGVPPPEADMS